MTMSAGAVTALVIMFALLFAAMAKLGGSTRLRAALRNQLPVHRADHLLRFPDDGDLVARSFDRMKITLTVQVEAPEGSTHYCGDLLDQPLYFKCTQVGVVGDHWWFWDGAAGWKFHSHHKPHWAKEIPPAGTLYNKE